MNTNDMADPVLIDLRRYMEREAVYDAYDMWVEEHGEDVSFAEWVRLMAEEEAEAWIERNRE